MKLILSSQYSELLLLLNGLVVLLFFAAAKKKRQRAMSFGNYETLQKVAGDNFLKSAKVILIVQLLAITSLIIGLSSPALQKQAPTTDADYVIAIDSSASMLQADIKPTRLDAAKTASTTFIDSTTNSTRIGVISFSGKVKQHSGLQADKEKLKETVENISMGETAGTAIGDAIYSSSTLLLDSNKSRKVIIITDGRNNVGTSLNDSINFARQQNVSVNTIGIGSINATRTENSSRADFPNLDTSNLKKISNQTGGNFTTATSSQELKNSFTKIETSKIRKDLSLYFFMAGLILILVQWALGTTRYDILP